MRPSITTAVTAAAVGLLTAISGPAFAAQANWEEYVYEEFGVAKEFPLPPARSQTIYAEPEGARDTPRIAGENRPSTLFQTELDDIVYKMEVIDISDVVERSANIFSECLYLSEQAGEELSNVHMGVGGEDSEIYGRLAEVDLYDDRGHLLTACFYDSGNLFRVEALIPEGGDIGSPAAYRFVSTVRFDLTDPEN
jgi:hypothetical protein